MVTVDEITSTHTAHRATRCPGGWAVTWLGDRTVTLKQACDAIELAELIENTDLRISRLDKATHTRITELTYDLCIWVSEAIQLIQAHPLSKPPVYDPVTGRTRDKQPKEIQMAEKTITEFAVQHTGRRYGKNVQVTDTLPDPTSRDQAEQVLNHILGIQGESDHLPIDAAIVTRTITTTDWQATT